jgi:hypothetical protein
MPNRVPKTQNMDQLKDRIVSILKAQEGGLTAVGLLSRLKDDQGPDPSAQDVKNALWSLVQGKESEVRRVGRILNKRNGSRINIYGLACYAVPERPKDEAENPIRTWGYNPDAYDEMRNTETLETIPEDHLAVVLECASRMRAFRQLDPPGRSVSGEKSKGSRMSCDAPIRQLFLDERNDGLEARYNALALWISWREENA